MAGVPAPGPELTVGVLADVAAVDRLLDYRVPARWAERVTVGTVVRVPLQGRRVRGWVLETARVPPPGITLREISKITGLGPPAELIGLAEWAAYRWAGRRLHFLRAASPLRSVSFLPDRPIGGAHPSFVAPAHPAAAPSAHDEAAALVRQAFAEIDAAAAGVAAGDGDSRGGGDHVERCPWTVRTLRWPPGSPRLGFALEALGRGPALLLSPSQHDADALARALRAAGHWIARHPQDWAAGAAGASVVGSRAAAWAPVSGLSSIVVFDEHDERYQDERSPTWNARDVVIERGRRLGVATLLVSPMPSLEALRAPLLIPSRATERRGWPLTTVIDRRELDPREGLYSAPVVEALRSQKRVAVVYNRTGRARLLACSRCGELCRCAQCGSALHSVGPAGQRRLVCASGAHERPELCLECGATRLSVLRPGVGRVSEEVSALIGAPVVEITASTSSRSRRRPEPEPNPASEPEPDAADPSPDPDAGPVRVWVGTEAVLHRLHRADLVIFLDLDQGLMAPRYRAGERTFALLALGARLVGGRQRGGQLIVQTRQPDHEVVQAALHGDPGRWAEVEQPRRHQLLLPPYAALALVDGANAADFAAELGAVTTLTVLGPTEGRYLVRAMSHAQLSEGLGQVPRPGTDLRIMVDPPGI